jgi:IS30 family transposase
VRRHSASWRGKSIVTNEKLRKFVEGALCDGQSPAAIAGRIRNHEKHLPTISKNTIYRFLDSPYGRLIRKKRKIKKYRKPKPKVDKLKDRTFIDKRPKIIVSRARLGDCEGDFIVSGRSGRGYLLVVVERKSRMCVIEKIEDVTIDNVHTAFLKIQKKFPYMKTLTLDNDILFRMHKTLEQLLDIPLYFCHPYHSWEKGSVENVNKYIRKYIAKGTNISHYSEEYISLVENKCNERYMECLGYATPLEELEKYEKRIKKQRLRAG